MPPSSDRPLQKVTMNFYRDDVAELVRVFGSGWTSEVRNIVANYIREHRAATQTFSLRNIRNEQ